MRSTLLLFALFSAATRAIQLCDAKSGVEYKGSNIENTGTYITTDRETKPYKFPKVRKCWFDYFIVNQTIYNSDWKKVAGDLDCSSTQDCQLRQIYSTETCQSRSTTTGFSIGIAPKTGIDIAEEGVALKSEIGGGLEFQYSVTLTESACFTAAIAGTCSWADNKCHALWANQQMLKQVGYARQRCNWGDGDVTECLADIELNSPTNATANSTCNGQCGSSFVPLPLPISQSSSSQSTSTSTSSSLSTIPPTTILSTATVTLAGSVVTGPASPAATASSSPSTSSATTIPRCSSSLGILSGIMFLLIATRASWMWD